MPVASSVGPIRTAGRPRIGVRGAHVRPPDIPTDCHTDAQACAPMAPPFGARSGQGALRPVHAAALAVELAHGHVRRAEEVLVCVMDREGHEAGAARLGRDHILGQHERRLVGRGRPRRARTIAAAGRGLELRGRGALDLEEPQVHQPLRLLVVAQVGGLVGVDEVDAAVDRARVRRAHDVVTRLELVGQVVVIERAERAHALQPRLVDARDLTLHGRAHRHPRAVLLERHGLRRQPAKSLRPQARVDQRGDLRVAGRRHRHG
mmetsp:Transcript_22702/g.56127  ORF Transcript_22702/g.56127 Transcript_22702/m.56127 type:complete len:263 (-) Transcript_22702:78-866(-)